MFDGGYWRALIKQLQITGINLVSLSDCLCKPAYRVRTHFFDGTTQENQSFHDGLRLLDRFEVFLGDVMPRHFTCPHCQEHFTQDTQKRVDVALAVELVHLATAGHVDLIVLVAGDRDFMPAIAAAKHAGVIVRLVHGPDTTVSEALRQAVDERITLTIDFLRSGKISYAVAPASKAPTPSESLTPSQVGKSPSRTPAQLKEVENIFAQLFSSSHFILNTAAGEAIKRLLPEWKKQLNVQNLRELVNLTGGKVRYQEIGGKQYITPSTTASAPLPSASIGSPALKKFVLKAIQDYYASSTTPLLASALGSLLLVKDNEWKDKFGVKKLKDAIQSLGDAVKIEGIGPQQIIRLK